MVGSLPRKARTPWKEVLSRLGLLYLLSLVSALFWIELRRYRRLEEKVSRLARVAESTSVLLGAVPELRFEDSDLAHQGAAKYD